MPKLTENQIEKIVVLKSMFANYPYWSERYETTSYKIATQCDECKDLALEYLKDKEDKTVQCNRCLSKEVEGLSESTIDLEKKLPKPPRVHKECK